MISEEEIFQRTGRLIGAEGLQRLQTASAIIFGVGGVGSWCAESLVRSGVRRLTMVDPDTVQASNINRQLPATVLTLPAQGRCAARTPAKHQSFGPHHGFA